MSYTSSPAASPPFAGEGSSSKSSGSAAGLAAAAHFNALSEKGAITANTSINIDKLRIGARYDVYVDEDMFVVCYKGRRKDCDCAECIHEESTHNHVLQFHTETLQLLSWEFADVAENCTFFPYPSIEKAILKKIADRRERRLMELALTGTISLKTSFNLPRELVRLICKF
jgi:hypothetical protein